MRHTCKSWGTLISFTCTFSSKHDGLAGTRFGWGLYEDSDLAMNVAAVIDTIVLGLSIDVELRVLASLQAILGKVDKAF